MEELAIKLLQLLCQVLDSPTLFIMTDCKEVQRILRSFAKQFGLLSKVFEISLCNEVKFGVALLAQMCSGLKAQSVYNTK